jgi:DNA-binding transcriptional ArsR family regulator
VEPEGDPRDSVSQERDPATARRELLDRLDAVARRVFDGLPVRGWRTEDEVSARAGVSIGEVLRALPALRGAGLIESSEEGHRLAPIQRA